MEKERGVWGSFIDRAFPVKKEKVEQPKVDTAQKQAVAESTTKPISSPSFQSPLGDMKGVVKQEMVEKLFESLNASDQPGIDFLEFYKAIKRSGSIRTADVVRNAFNMLGGIDPTISKSKLLSTADAYISVLKAEIDGFNQSFPSIVEGAVGDNKKKVDENNREIESLNAQLVSINNRIRELNEANAALSDEVAQQQVKLDRMRADFDATSSSVHVDLQEVVDLIKAHIQDEESEQSSK